MRGVSFHLLAVSLQSSATPHIAIKPNEFLSRLEVRYAAGNLKQGRNIQTAFAVSITSGLDCYILHYPPSLHFREFVSISHSAIDSKQQQ